LSLVSDISGLVIGVLGLVSSISGPLTYNHTASRFIEKLYIEKGYQNRRLNKRAVDFHEDDKCILEETLKKSELPKKFTLLEKMDNIWWMKGVTCWFRKHERMKNANIYKRLFTCF